ncbi:MAG: UDP-2,3-diacylglucosamine diphosphatase LpxI [Candidatus Omnitrophica bacterium]|nr:UDP-2,3-diacylglucosamine diphosphatase LpxI [Candidatus Omnitrophota bacterium]
MPKIGLVAGWGKIPVTFARNAKAKGDTVIALGLKGVTDEELANHVDKMHWVEWGNLKKAMLLVMMEGIRQIVLLGKIKKAVTFTGNDDLDEDAKKILSGMGSKQDYAILKGVEGILSKVGIKIIDPTPYLEDLVPKAGALTKRQPSDKEWADIKYGTDIAKVMAGYDIGQAVAVKDKTIIAAEAVEGTNDMIKRAGSLAGGGFVVVKVARPDQDMRFDVPAVGPDTIRLMAESRATALGLEGNKTFLTDREEVVALADQNDIAITIM